MSPCYPYGMSIDVSIIMPVYKNAATLARSLDSILAQDFEGTFEVILSADDSGDGTLDICRDYAARFPDKIILHYPGHRMGLSLARAEAFELVRGEYIYACDADDELRPDTLRILVDTIRSTDADLVNCSFYTTEGSKQKARANVFVRPKRVMSREKAMSALMMDATFRAFLWSKLFKASLLKQYPRIAIQNNKSMFEDLAFVSSLLVHCKKVVSIPTHLYYYYKDNPDSAVSISRSDRSRWHVAVFASVRLLLDMVADPALLKAFRRKKWRAALSVRFDLGIDKKNGLAKEGRKECLGVLKTVFGKEKLDPEHPYFADFIRGSLISK